MQWVNGAGRAGAHGKRLGLGDAQGKKGRSHGEAARLAAVGRAGEMPTQGGWVKWRAGVTREGARLGAPGVGGCNGG